MKIQKKDWPFVAVLTCVIILTSVLLISSVSSIVSVSSKLKVEEATNDVEEATNDVDDDWACCEGIEYLVIQPDETFTEKELIQLSKDIVSSAYSDSSNNYFIDLGGGGVIVMKPVHFPKNSNETPQRVRADSILYKYGWISIIEDSNKIWFSCFEEDNLDYQFHVDKHVDRTKSVIYLTKNDICCTKGDKANWGVLGLSFLGKGVSIVSTHRLKHRKDLVKLIAREDNHAMGMPHCKNDDKSCIMKDAKGHPDLEHETHICDRCRKEYEEKYGSY